MKMLLAVFVLCLAASATPAQNMTPNVTHVNFANSDGTSLFSDQTGFAPVIFTITQGPITLKQNTPMCKQNVGSPGEYTAECDDVKMDGGCLGTWQTGQQCTTTFSLLADDDDNRCDIHGPNPAYPDGCEGIIQVKVPLSNANCAAMGKSNGCYNLIPITYSYQWQNMNPLMKVTQPTFIATTVGQSSIGEAMIFNSGDVPLQLSLGASTNSAFTFNPTDCPNPLPAQQTCGINITFTPTKAGPTSGTIPLTDNATDQGVKTIVLKGTGK